MKSNLPSCHLFAIVSINVLAICCQASRGDNLRLATFSVDATPPLGSRVAYAPVREIEAPLSARGIVLLGAGKPIVMCSVDWIGIGNEGYDYWREQLAEGAGTTPDRVAVHAIHQHDGPWCDFASERLLQKLGQPEGSFDVIFARRVVVSAADAIRKSIEKASPVTHVATGQGRVEKVASNRRILDATGKHVDIVRWSKTQDPAAINAPEGLIDPNLKMLSFWNGDESLACLCYYATHPQSYYGDGDVTPEFVGLARNRREAHLDGLLHVYFTGAAGNVTAGKYNVGDPAARKRLTERMEAGMKIAWEASVKCPISAAEVSWRVKSVTLPVSMVLDGDELVNFIHDPANSYEKKFTAALSWNFVNRMSRGEKIDISCLKLGDAYVLHMPGELFVEYQLAAQQMKPKGFVCMAAYGDYGPGYIGTEAAYPQGGYEVQKMISNVAPEVEGVLIQAMQELLSIEE